MVIPVVVICYIVARSLVLHTLKVALTVVPEVVEGVSYVRRLLCIESAVALSLVSIRACIAVEEIAVVYPDVVVALLESAVIAL